MMAKFHSEMAKLTEGLPKEYVALTTKGASESLSIMAGVLCAASWQENWGMPEGKAQFDAAFCRSPKGREKMRRLLGI